MKEGTSDGGTEQKQAPIAHFSASKWENTISQQEAQDMTHYC